MNRRNDWQAFEAELKRHGISKLYHFTDRDNLETIIRHGGLYSWWDCQQRGIQIPKPGGGGPGSLSWGLDKSKGLQSYVRVSFTREHPMMYVAMKEERISNPVILEIDPEVIYAVDTLYADQNATSKAVSVGATLDDFRRIHFDSVRARTHFDLPIEEQPYYQAEVMVKSFIPLKYITNISNFGIPIPTEPQKLQTKHAYTARITREHPSAFVFLVDQSISMRRITTFNSEDMTMSEAVARIVNSQIDELVERCVRASETRHYFDIAVVGYGDEAYSAWNGALAGRGFASPEEIRFNEYRKIKVKEQVRTRAGVKEVEVEKKQWLEARHDGKSTSMHKAFRHAEGLIDTWLRQHQAQDCYPPIIINITDGEYNGASREEMQQLANRLKAKFTNDGNVLLFNIHIVPGRTEAIMFPANIDEMRGNGYSESLFEMSSLLPLNYNEQIRSLFQDKDDSIRYRAMGVNAGMEQLVKMMKIGTLSSAMVQQTI